MKLMTVVRLTVCHQHPRPHSPATTGDQTGPIIYSWSNLGLGALHPPCRQGLCPLPTTHTLGPGLCPLLLGPGLGQEGLPNFLEGNSMPAPSRYISSLDGERKEGRKEGGRTKGGCRSTGMGLQVESPAAWHIPVGTFV